MARKRNTSVPELYQAVHAFTWHGATYQPGVVAVAGHPVLGGGRQAAVFRPLVPTFGSLPDPEPEPEAPAEPEG